MGGGGSQLGGYGGSPYGGGTNFGQPGPPLAKLPQQQQAGGVGSAGWIATHPNFQAPAQGAGSIDWIKTHPNFGMGPQQPGQEVPQGWGSGAPLAQFPAGAGQGNTPGMNNDFMDVLQRMFGGGNMPGGAWTGGTPGISFVPPPFMQGGQPYKMF